MAGGVYDEYRLIITNNHIELKLRPIEDKVNEINFFMPNTSSDRDSLYYQLEKIYNHGKRIL